jgi:BirA family biotin operon repressor/biotin-[acetyl-CoA-carboxylase] ligase
MIQEKIIDFLKRKQDYISGEELSQRFNISRQALWKHIQDLKEAGYGIEAMPHLGYCLLSVPDRLFPFEVEHNLGTKIIGKKIYYLESVSSTMDVASSLGAQGAGEGTVVLAETQTKGRGRLGRSWLSPKYKGIYLSLILRPKISPQQAPVLTLLAAVSVSEAIKELTEIETQIKWPNDILLEHKKLGGILTELNAETDQVRFLVIGIGLNVNNDKKSLVPGATSLREKQGKAVNRVEFLQGLLRRIELSYTAFQKHGAKTIVEKWRQFNSTLGKRVIISRHHTHIEGEAVDIDEDGSLLLRIDSGLIQRIASADILTSRE